MKFVGISKVFSTIDNQQIETIGAFWDELSKKYGRSKLRGLGYNWTDDSIEYVIGLKEGKIEYANCSVTLPDEGWLTVRGKTSDLGKLYEQIYLSGSLQYEIEIFFEHDECEIKYYR